MISSGSMSRILQLHSNSSSGFDIKYVKKFDIEWNKARCILLKKHTRYNKYNNHYNSGCRFIDRKENSND